MKKIVSVSVSFLLCILLFTSCDLGSKGEPQIGKKVVTSWFSYTVESVERVKSYNGYEPEAGNELLLVRINEKNTFPEPIIMGTFDFYIDSDSFEDYVWPMSPFAEKMMPDEYYLDVTESVTYEMLFEVPAGLEDLKLMYTEFDEDGGEGETYSISLPSNESI